MKSLLATTKALAAILTVGFLVFGFQNCAEVDFAMPEKPSVDNTTGQPDTDDGSVDDDDPNPSPTPEDEDDDDGSPTPTPTATPEWVPTATPSPTPAPSATPEMTPTPTPSPTPEMSPTPTATPDMSPSPTPAPSATPEMTPTPSPTPEMSPSPTPAPSATPEMTPTPSPTPTATPSPTASPTPAPSATPSPSPTATPSPTPRPTATPSPTPKPSPTPTPEPGCGCADVKGAKIYIQVARIEIGSGKNKVTVAGPGSVELSVLNSVVANALMGLKISSEINVVLGDDKSYVKCSDNSMHLIDTPSAVSSGLKTNQGNSSDNAYGANQIHIVVDGTTVNLKENGNGKCMMHPHIEIDLGGGSKHKCD